jgi:hypothetical protein
MHCITQSTPNAWHIHAACINDEDYGKRLNQQAAQRLQAKDAASLNALSHPISHTRMAAGVANSMPKLRPLLWGQFKMAHNGQGSPVGDPIAEIVEGLPPTLKATL